MMSPGRHAAAGLLSRPLVIVVTSVPHVKSPLLLGSWPTKSAPATRNASLARCAHSPPPTFWCRWDAAKFRTFVFRSAWIETVAPGATVTVERTRRDSRPSIDGRNERWRRTLRSWQGLANHLMMLFIGSLPQMVQVGHGQGTRLKFALVVPNWGKEG